MEKYFYAIIILVILVLLYATFWFIKLKRKILSESKKNFLNWLLKEIEKQKNPRQEIIDYDKLYHRILKELWYKGDFWNILKSNPKEISDINKIWDLHKFRNKLVHDFDTFSENVIIKNANDYKLEIKKMLK